MIPIFVASSERFAGVEWMAEFSIRQNTSADVAVHIIRPDLHGMQETGCTGFTNVRYTVPQLCREMGYDFGIYLDVDMLVVGDIAELWEYRRAGHWVCLEDGSDEVSVVCASLQYPDKSRIHERHKASFSRGSKLKAIPLAWNCEDEVKEGMKILHFTDLNAQPWTHEHPNAEAVALYESYRTRYWPKPDEGSAGTGKRVKTSKVRVQQHLSGDEPDSAAVV